jgi:hypothetical protein
MHCIIKYYQYIKKVEIYRFVLKSLKKCINQRARVRWIMSYNMFIVILHDIGLRIGCVVENSYMILWESQIVIYRVV